MEGIDDMEFFGSLRVTDRGLDIYRKFIHFVPETLPQGALVINVGGGENQTFEKQLMSVRPDINITTLDPSLHSENAIHAVNGEKDFRTLTKEEINARIESLPNKDRTFEAYGQQMPSQIKPSSVDAILDVHAASQWSKDLDEYKKFIQESIRVLKPGGKLYIGNVYFGDPIPDDEASEFSAVKQARDVFDSLALDAEVFISQEQTLPEYEGKQNVVDNRVCAIVTK